MLLKKKEKLSKVISVSVNPRRLSTFKRPDQEQALSIGFLIREAIHRFCYKEAKK